jgi:hypothetical protein
MLEAIEDKTVEVRQTTVFCAFGKCAREFTPINRQQRFCSARCRAKAYYAPVKEANFARRLARFRERRRSISLGFDGRLSGPRNLNYLGGRSQ